MPTLLERIEASANARLTLPPGRKPTQEIARYKNFLKVESHRIKIFHKSSTSGRAVCRARSYMIDLLLRHIVQTLHQGALAEGKKVPPCALAAIGGYGRGELNPWSDIDIMLLHEAETPAQARQHPYLAMISEGILVDIGLKVGFSVRSVEDCVAVGNSDMQSKTSLIESRLILGEAALFDRMERVVIAKCVRGHEDEYIAARLEDQAKRRSKHGDSASMQEPNIKNGCGGLRDYQNLFWMAYFKYRARTTQDLQARELINASEATSLDAAYDFLLRVRNDLHYHAGRPVDVLHKSVQPAIARNLGYTGRSPRFLIEPFMRDLYRHLRNIYLITRTLEQRLALLPQPDRKESFLKGIFRRRQKPPVDLVVDSFRFVDGQILPANPRVFREQPRRLMRVFLYAQQRGLRLNPDLAQMIRNQLSLVNREFLADPHVHETFLEILSQRGTVAPILRAMHDVDFLGKFLPEFGKLTCKVQHEFFHRYAADEHTLMCVEKLDRVWDAADATTAHYNELFRKVERPFILYLALILHDTGKGGARKHELESADLALRVAKRLKLDGATTHTLRLLVEKHLLLVQVSQRRDLDDPGVIRYVAAEVQTLEHLQMLTVMTYVDSLATSETLWNEFKDSLLWSLYHKVAVLLGGGSEFIRAEEKQRELLADEVRRIAPASFSDDEVIAHFQTLPSRYFQIHPARAILTDLSLAHRFMHQQLALNEDALLPVIAWHNETDRGYTAVKVCTWDRTALFSKIAGALTAAGLNILSAQIFSRTDGIIIDTFFVNDARTGKLVNREEREKFETLLNGALVGEEADFGSLISKMKLPPPMYQALEGEGLPTVILFDNDSSETRTVIDIEAQDRVGLLYDISRVLTSMDLDISVAKISTEKGAASDSFYVAEVDGQKITTPERQKQMERRLRAAIGGQGKA